MQSLLFSKYDTLTGPTVPTCSMHAGRQPKTIMLNSKCLLVSEMFTDAPMTDPGAESFETSLSKLQVEPHL